ncbi:MAG: PIG-L family deacetylase [Acidobacteriales bacterium]|nr:PIG-L family deacetylase [Terriglobales bacterium]
MFNLLIKNGTSEPLRVLCLGAHSDDIEIGCAGTIMNLIRRCPGIHIDWVVFGAQLPQRAKEARASAEVLLRDVKQSCVVIKRFRDSHFPNAADKIKAYFETLKGTDPDVIFTHQRNDLHQDHLTISELTWQTFRDHFILEYEIPKYDGDLGAPNLFVHLSEPVFRRKTAHILEHFDTQTDRHWFSRETFSSIARLRAIESRAPSGYAEAFYCRKLVLNVKVQ